MKKQKFIREVNGKIEEMFIAHGNNGAVNANVEGSIAPKGWMKVAADYKATSADFKVPAKKAAKKA